ncbi:hypothetical protein U5801_15625 [Lamprobacter modestohalophilus]|uniref:hypothetical protein n=1 Tax=Lamprobacter modestohalophilus TaxID=1064514 RepID=UPI002ADEB99D|nr:hypothetical protein [Lamprobacter modestohalophilus]MEA1051223.1 hypothetical protein [Lamprobacter modestohalophilus]
MATLGTERARGGRPAAADRTWPARAGAAPVGLWLPFEITDWQPERAWFWQVADLPATGHEVLPLDAGRCQVRFLIPSWAPLYRPVCRRALQRIAARAQVVSRG